MHPIEVETFPNRDQEKDRDKPNRVGLERYGRNDPIGDRPPQQTFKQAPDRDTGPDRPQHIIQQLVIEGEHPSLAWKGPGIIFERRSLARKPVEPKVQNPGKKCHDYRISHPNLSHPPWRELSSRYHVR